MARATVWWARLAQHTRGREERSLVAVQSDRFPDGAVVDLSAPGSGIRRPSGWLVEVRYRPADARIVRVEVSPSVAAPGPDLWFAELFHATSGIPAVSVLAFSGDAFPPGSVVTPHHVTARGLAMRERIGEVRWWTRSGMVDTVTVEPAARGHGLGRTLVSVAEGICMLRGWATLRSDGRLTDAGAAWLERSPAYWRGRLAKRTSRIPDDDDEPGPSGVAALLR